MPKIYISFFVFAATLFTQYLGISPVDARWATYEDAPAEIEISSDIIIDKNGKSEEIVEKQIKIINETGRDIFGVQRIHFNENIEQVEIIEAKAIIQGKAQTVPKEMIETKPLASDIKGFDQLFQILISYPHVGVGTQIYLKYKITIFKQPLPNYFSLKYYYGGDAYWKRAQFKVRSKLPFHALANDPDRKLEIKEGKEGQYQTLEIIAKKPAYGDLINESGNNQVPDHLKTWVHLSTYEKFEDLSKALSKDYEEVIHQDLPPLHESIKNSAATISSPVEQINKVTSLLSEKIRYMGDWRTIKGKLAPRSLNTVAESGVGDCKDFAACTASILNALGYKAQVALVMRGTIYLPPERTLPSLLYFNHAIVKATAKDGKVFWIDPTNFASMADGIFPDISNRPALVLDAKTPSYEKVPGIDYKHSKIDIKNTLGIKDKRTLSDEGSIKLSGEQAQEPAGAGLCHSLQSIEEAIVRQLSGETSPSKKKVTLPPLDSRIVKDLEFSYAYEQENDLLLTNAGPGILLKFSWAQAFMDTSDCQKGTTFIGLPLTLTRKTTIQDVDERNMKDLACDLDSPWVKAKRECRPVEGGIEINEQISLLKSFVTAEEASSTQYKNLKKSIKKYFNKLAIIVAKKD
jgi:hypothetical protein